MSTPSDASTAGGDASDPTGPSDLDAPVRATARATSPGMPSVAEKTRALQDGKLDHPKGQPLPGYCDISKVPWEEKPEVLGMTRLTRFDDVADAEKHSARSYVIVKRQHFDRDKDGVSDFSMIVTRHFVPTREGGIYDWVEISTLIVEDCTVRNTQVLLLTVGKDAPRPRPR